MSTPNALHVARSPAEVEELRGVWETLPWRQVDTELDFYLEVARTRDEVVRPHAIVVEVDGRPRAAVAARVEDIALASRLGYWTVFAPRVRSLTLALGGLALDDEDAAARDRLVGSLLGSLAQREADVIWLPRMPSDSPFVTSIIGEVGAFRSQQLPPTVHYRLALPESFEAFLTTRSRKTRKGIRQTLKQVEDAFGQEMSIEVIRDVSEAERMFDALDQVATNTYQRGLGVGFVNSPEQRALIESALARGLYRAYILRISGRPVAFWTAWDYRGTIFIHTTAYEPDYASFSVGVYLLVKVIEDLCGDDRIETIDFGHGEAPYKRQFGSESSVETDLYVFGPTVKSVAIKLTRASIAATDRGARRVAAATGKSDSLKRVWRRRLASSAQEEEVDE